MYQTTLQKIIRILSKDPKERNVIDKKMLVELTKDIAFFQQYQENAYVHESCCSYMTYEAYQDKETVFEINSIGDKFYIILEGSVGVYIYNESKELICVKKLVKGTSFGELALLYESPRMATIICQENSHFAVLQKREFLRVLKNEQKEKLNRKLLYLQNLPLFQKINQQLLRLIYSKAFDINTTKGQIIFKQGEPTQNFYIVKSGEFSVKHEIYESSDKEESQSIQSLENKELSQVTNIGKQKTLPVQIALLVQGDYFGEEDILQNRQKRSFTVECMTASGEIIMVQRNLFTSILDEYHPNIFLRQHLAIKENQYFERINNGKRQMKKFKSFLIEDRKQLKVKKQIEEEQNNFQKTNRSIQTTKEKILGTSRSILTKQKNEDGEPQNFPNRRKKSLTQAVIDEESQRKLNEKIQKLIELKELEQAKKPKIPSQKEIKYNNHKYPSSNSPLPLVQNKSITFNTEQSSPLNDKSYNSGNSSNATPTDSPSIKPNNKAYLLRILQQKPPYKQSLFNDNSLFDKYQKFSQNTSEIHQDFNLDSNNIPDFEDQEEHTQVQQNKNPVLNRKAYSQKNLVSQKLSLQNLSQTNLENKSDYSQSQTKKISNNSDLIIGRITELGRAKRVVISEDNKFTDREAKEGPAQIFRNKKIVSFSQNHASNFSQNISSTNDPEKLSTNEQLKNMFDDGSQTKFISNYFNRSQVRKLTESQKTEQDSYTKQERADIKKQLLRLKSKRENYIDYSSDDQKRYLIDQINTLTSPRQESNQAPNTQRSSILPKQSSQPTLRYIDLQRQEVPESNLRMTQNQLINGSVTDIQKKKKNIKDLNSQSFQILSQQPQTSNIFSSKQQMANTSLVFKVDFGSCRTIQNSAPNSTHHLFNGTSNPQTTNNLPLSSTKNTFHSNSSQQIQTKNIHTQKEQQDQNRSKPLKMSIRFQNLFKNH